MKAARYLASVIGRPQPATGYVDARQMEQGARTQSFKDARGSVMVVVQCRCRSRTT
jgi:hypothetical protein